MNHHVPLIAILSMVLVALGSTVVLAAGATSFDDATLSVSWDSAAVVASPHTPARLAGEASRGGSGSPFVFTVACAPDPCVGVQLSEVTLLFGDGDRVEVDHAAGVTRTWSQGELTTTSGALTTTTHHFRDPGTYTVVAQVVGRTGITDDVHTTLRATVDVAEPTADVIDVIDPVVRDALLRIRSLGALEGCGPAIGTYNSTAPTRSGRSMLCPDPASVFTDPPDGDTTGVDSNGQTGTDCLERFYACGLDAVDFSAGGSPYDYCVPGRCTPGSLGVAAGTNWATDGVPEDLRYLQGRCGDGLAAERHSGAWVLRSGVEPGCATRGDLYTALVLLVDGTDAGRPVGSTLACDDAAGFSRDERYPVLRAQTLGVPALRAHDPHDTPTLCAVDLPARRDEVYAALGAVLGVSADPATSGLLDLVDLHLGHPPAGPTGGVPYDPLPSPLPQPDADLIAGAIDAGVPLPGDTTCPDGQTPCLNPDVAVTVSELAQLLDSVLVRGAGAATVGG